MDMNRFFFWRPAWMGFLSRVLLDGMVWISGLFPASIGWGMGIICLTLLVKLLFWPLSHKSTVSMRRMQALQPQLKELREKYKDDPTKMYRKQQELFNGAQGQSQFGGACHAVPNPGLLRLFKTFRKRRPNCGTPVSSGPLTFPCTDTLASFRRPSCLSVPWLS